MPQKVITTPPPSATTTGILNFQPPPFGVYTYTYMHLEWFLHCAWDKFIIRMHCTCHETFPLAFCLHHSVIRSFSQCFFPRLSAPTQIEILEYAFGGGWCATHVCCKSHCIVYKCFLHTYYIAFRTNVHIAWLCIVKSLKAEEKKMFYTIVECVAARHATVCLFTLCAAGTKTCRQKNLAIIASARFSTPKLHNDLYFEIMHALVVRMNMLYKLSCMRISWIMNALAVPGLSVHPRISIGDFSMRIPWRDGIFEHERMHEGKAKIKK